MAQQVIFFLRSDLAKAIPVSKQRAYQIAESVGNFSTLRRRAPLPRGPSP